VYWLYAHAQDLIDVSVLSILLCTMPVFSVFFAYTFLNERLTVPVLAGGAIIVAGIAVIATEQSVHV
ncbi:MAG TPA: EamA family transporter, partial [Candidatus Binatia bacterium]|jgi:drug/metabolite transporter (DMT)-like permease